MKKLMFIAFFGLILCIASSKLISQEVALNSDNVTSADSQLFSIENEIKLPTPVKVSDKSMVGSSLKFTGGYVKNGDDLHRFPSGPGGERERDCYLDGRTMPPKSEKLLKEIAQKYLETRKNRANQGLSLYKDWCDFATNNGIIDYSKLTVFSYKNITVHRVSNPNIKIASNNVVGYKGNVDLNSILHDQDRDGNPVKIEELSQSELVNFKGFVSFRVLYNSEEETHFVEVTINNSYVKYHINERTQRIDSVSFPTFNTGLIFWKDHISYKKVRHLVDHTSGYFLSDGKRNDGCFRGEPVGVFEAGATVISMKPHLINTNPSVGYGCI